MSEENKCNCNFCQLYAKRTEALASDDIDVVKKALIEFSDLWLSADFDLSYYKCILDGSWPQAEEILTRSLEKAKNHPNRKVENYG